MQHKTVTVDVGGLNQVLDGALVEVSTGEVHAFSIEAEFWQGVEGGESWHEGSVSGKVYLGSVPRGRYALRIESSGGGSGRNAGNDLEWDTGLAKRGNLFTRAAEDKRIASLQTDNGAACTGVCDQHGVNFFLRNGFGAASLAHRIQFGGAG